MSEALDHVRQVCAEFDAANPHWREIAETDKACRRERQERELAEEREQKATRKAREAAEMQQVASTNWYTAVDERVHEHLKNWLWNAIDERIRWWFDFYFSGTNEDNNQRGLYADAIGRAMGMIRKQVCEELRRADEEMQRALEAKLAVLEERLASNDRILIETTGGPQGQVRLREELKRALNELADAFGVQIAALEERLRAVPGKLPVAKTYCPDTVHYAGHVVVHQGATYQALRDTARAPPHVDDWI
jgi:hypothetical protein